MIELLNLEFYRKAKEKEKKKKDKKDKKDKERRKEEKKRNKEKKQNDANLIDFVEEKDAFGDFHEGESATNEKNNKQNNDYNNLIGNDDNDFGEFVVPENNKKDDDDFGDFISSANNTTSHSAVFNSAPQVNNNNLLNNLSSLYNQAPPQSDPNNKYAALENINQPYMVQQPANDIFFGMNLNAGGAGYNQGFQQPQPTFNLNAPQPGLVHQHSWNGASQSTDFFGQNQFQSQPAFPEPTGFNQPFASARVYNSSDSNFMSGQTSSIAQSAPPSGDLFGLKATLKQNNKYHKYDKAGSAFSMTSDSSKKKDTSVFSGLVATQWKS